MFAGTGAYRYVDATLPGQHLPGVLAAWPFLVANGRRVLLGDEEDRGTEPAPTSNTAPTSKPARTWPVAGWSQAAPEIDVRGKRVVVLGGGDTGMDCVRTAIRLGAAEVTCIYRRDEAAMPGSKREVKNAKDEGVRFLFNRQPQAIDGEGAAAGVRVVETRASANGSRSVGRDMVDGSETVIAADVVILAFGFRPDPAAWLSAHASEQTPDQRLVVGQSGRLPFQTAQPKLFAGGDEVRGADLVVTAVADGRDAAASIERFLGATG